jgi:hypothetical protein
MRNLLLRAKKSQTVNGGLSIFMIALPAKSSLKIATHVLFLPVVMVYQ